MLKHERRVSFPGSYDSALLQGRITELHTRIAQSASIRGLFKASDHVESVALTEARAVEQSHKRLLFVIDEFVPLNPYHVFLIRQASPSTSE